MGRNANSPTGRRDWHAECVPHRASRQESLHTAGNGRITFRTQFEGGTIDRVVVNVTDAPYVDHEKEVKRYLTRE
ncbi:MAG TPA: hypothetical protein VIL18_06585 [Longimicrobiales bacterium]